MLSALVNIIAAPRLAYEQLRNKPTMLFPIVLLLVVISATTFTFFQLANPDLLIDDLLQQAGDDMSDAEREQALAGMQSMPASPLKWFSTLSGSMGLLVMLLLHAGYYYLTSMFNGTKIGFKLWLSFVAWSNIPTLFASIAGLATLLLASGHVPLMEINPFTLSNLLRLESDNPALVSVMNNLDLTRLWSVGLMLIGYRIWTQKSWLHCCTVVMLPLLVIFGAMFALAL
jgi:hypothetical protein